MLTLVSTLLGLLTSGLPKLLDFFQNDILYHYDTIEQMFFYLC